MANKRTKLRRQSIVARITCPLCSSLLVDATSISPCLHAFCRTCIYNKLADDAFDTCPVCDVNLGSNPVEKLRPDHSLQNIRAKIFSVTIRNSKVPDAPEVVPSVSPPAKRKERLLSSLLGMPSESVHNTSSTGRRSHPIATNLTVPIPSGSSLCIEECLQSPCDQKSDEHAGNRTAWLDVAAIPNGEENGHKTKIQDDKNDIQSATAPAKRKRGRPPSRNTKKSLGKSPNSAAVAVRSHHQNAAIWFSLVASEDRQGAAHLPRISSGFLRIKDNSMPVSVIQKYIAERLQLPNEEEVEIAFQGKSVLPTDELSILLGLWRKDAPAHR